MADNPRFNFVDADWPHLVRLARAYLYGGTDWAERDEDEEALEIRAARDFAREILKSERPVTGVN